MIGCKQHIFPDLTGLDSKAVFFTGLGWPKNSRKGSTSDSCQQKKHRSWRLNRYVFQEASVMGHFKRDSFFITWWLEILKITSCLYWFYICQWDIMAKSHCWKHPNGQSQCGWTPIAILDILDYFGEFNCNTVHLPRLMFQRSILKRVVKPHNHGPQTTNHSGHAQVCQATPFKSSSDWLSSWASQV